MSSKIKRQDIEKALQTKNVDEFKDLWQVDPKEEGLKWVRAICEFMDNNERKSPSPHSKKNLEEARLGQKLSHLKAAKQGKGADGKKSKFYTGYLVEAKKRGYPKLFELVDRKAEGLQAIRAICDFIKENKRNPSTTAKNVEEAILGRKLSTFKKAKQGSKNCKWDDKYLVEAKKLGYPNLFEIVNLKKEGLEWVIAICEFMDKNDGKSPSQHSKDLEEKRLGQKLRNFKTAKHGKGSTIWYKDYLVEAKKQGYPKLFDLVDRKQEGLDDINAICEFMDSNEGKSPLDKSSNLEEAILGRKLGTFKKAKRGSKNCKWYKEYLVEAKKQGYPKLFELSRQRS